MIRNYYTDSYKSGIPVAPSDTLLIDGRTKADTPIGAWKQYNLYIGSSPSSLPVTTTTDNSAVSGVNVGLKSPNPLIKAGMIVKGTGLPDAGTEIASVTNASNYVLSGGSVTIAADATLTYTYANEAAIKVHTINNEVITFVNPIKGSILPVSVVQVYSTDTQGGVTDIVALS
jgi:hypothetical protein